MRGNKWREGREEMKDRWRMIDRDRNHGGKSRGWSRREGRSEERMEGWEDVGREEGDKQRMIGCQATDKKHKVNVKLTDHKERACPLLCLVLSIPLSLSLSVAYECRSLYLLLYCCYHSLLFPWEKTFLSFFWHFLSFTLSLSPTHTIWQ